MVGICLSFSKVDYSGGADNGERRVSTSGTINGSQHMRSHVATMIYHDAMMDATRLRRK